MSDPVTQLDVAPTSQSPSPSPSPSSSTTSSSLSSSPRSPDGKVGGPAFCDVPEATLCLYEYLPYTGYAGSSGNPRDALALLHNGVRRELSDYITFVLPALRSCSSASRRSLSTGDLGELQHHWDATAGYFFFVSGVHEDVAALCASYLPKAGVASTEMGRVRRMRAVITQRYSFSMHHFFKNVDQAMLNLYSARDSASAHALADAIDNCARFMLACVGLVDVFVEQVLHLAHVDIVHIERNIMATLFDFARRNGHQRHFLYFYISIRWIRDQSAIIAWLGKYSGLFGGGDGKGNGDKKTDENEHTVDLDQWCSDEQIESRQQFLDTMKSTYLHPIKQ